MPDLGALTILATTSRVRATARVAELGQWSKASIERGLVRRLKRFSVEGFRSYTMRQEIEFDPSATILVGRNNVGKTALMRALRLPLEDVPGVAGHCSLEYTWTLDAETTVQEMHLSSAPHFDSLVEMIRGRGYCDFHVQLHSPPLSDDLRPEPAPASTFAGQDRTIGRFEVERLEIPDSDLVLVPYQNPGFTPKRAMLGWLNRELRDGQFPGDIAPAAVGLLNRLLSLPLYIQPRRKTDPGLFQVTTTLSTDGSNLTQVMASLFTNERHTTHAALEAFIADVFPEIHGLDVRMSGVNPTAEIIVNLGHQGRLAVPLADCGTGIEQLLMLGTAVLTAQFPRVFLIDEPHAYLHPHAERGLLRFLDQHPEHQFIIATHSGGILNAYPLSSARLITIGDEGSRIAAVIEKSEVLEELGVTAIDLWSSDALLWVEGPSDVAVFERLQKATGLGASVAVKMMPNVLRASVSKPSRAKQIAEFYEMISQALLPVETQVLFLFDSDEHIESRKQEIESATSGDSRFLPVRELENLFLSIPALTEDLTAICSEYGLPLPTAERVEELMTALLGSIEDPKLYPSRPSSASPAQVVGSELLARLYFQVASYPYEKVGDGPRLAMLVHKHEPTRLSPILEVLNSLC